jgi:RNA polymerase sigma-70 factor (ECF subfamily)
MPLTDTTLEQRRLSQFEEQRPRLLGIAYRMLGTVTDADDVLQEAWLRWSAVNLFGVLNREALLTTIVTRLSLDRLRRERVRREVYAGPWLPELVADDTPAAPDPAASAEMADSLSVAVLALMERLSPLERAAFVLRVVFGYHYAEVAAALDRTESATRQLVHRAQRHLGDGRRRFPADGSRHLDVTRRFIAACGSAQLGPLLDVLAPDVVIVSDGGGVAKAPPKPVAGRDHVARFLVGVLHRMPRGSIASVESFNGTTGVVVRVNGEPISALAIRVDGDHVASLQLVANPAKLAGLRPPVVRRAIS